MPEVIFLDNITGAILNRSEFEDFAFGFPDLSSISQRC